MGVLRGAFLLAGLGLVGCSTAAGPACAPDRTPSAAEIQASLDALSRYLDGFHVYADEDGQTVRARHVASRVNSDMHACVVYDRRGGDDELIGVELVISARLHAALPPEEQALWHPHRDPTVAWTGAPGVHEELASTYGQMWYPEDFDLQEAGLLVARAR